MDTHVRDLTEVTHIVELLDHVGYVVLEDHVRGTMLEQLIAEHTEAFENRPTGVQEPSYRIGTASRALRVVRDEKRDRLPATHAFMDDPQLSAVAYAYLGMQARPNEAAYLTLDLPEPRPVTEVHYDRIHALKSFLYLTDADQQSGALEVVPGSRASGRALRHAHITAGIAVADLPITVGHDAVRTIPIAASAGTLILLDTDCLHRGGVVSAGRVRRVLRAHSHAADEGAVAMGARD